MRRGGKAIGLGDTNKAGGTRAGSTSKDELLQLSVDLANTSPPGTSAQQYAVAHVSLTAVANAAGVTRGALYRLWPTQDAFWNDLVELIMSSSTYRHSYNGSNGSNGSNGGPFSKAQLPSWIGTSDHDGHLADTAQDLLLLDRSQLLQAGLAGYPRATAPTAATSNGRAEHPHRSSRQVTSERGANGFASLDGLTATDIAIAAAAVGAGLPVTGRLTTRCELTIGHPAFTDIDADAPRSLLGLSLAAIRAELVRPHDLDAAGRLFDKPPPLPPPTDRHIWGQPTNGKNGSATEPSGRRHDYLQLGAKLAADHSAASDGLTRVLGHVTLDGLARAANVTRRTLTNVWPDQVAFRLDLFSHLLARERQWITTAIAEATAEHRRHHQTDQQIFRRIGDTIHAALADHVDNVSFLAFAPVLTAREATTRAQHDHDQLLDATAVELAALLDATGRQPRRGLTLRQIALAIYVLADGTNRLMRTTSNTIRDDIIHDDSQHTLTGFVTSSILTHTTEVVGTRPKASDIAAALIS